MATQEQIDSFHEFASRQVSDGAAELSIAELFDLWQVQNPTASELGDSVVALKAALQDMENGDTGRPLAEFVDDLRGHSNGPEE